MRKLATIIPVPTATSLGVPTLESDPSDANWTSEVASVSEDSSMSLGKRSLFPHPLSKLIKMSNELMRIATIPAEQLVRNRLAYNGCSSLTVPCGKGGSSDSSQKKTKVLRSHL
jgi:HK97 family phage major capsid protein